MRSILLNKILVLYVQYVLYVFNVFNVLYIHDLSTCSYK